MDKIIQIISHENFIYGLTESGNLCKFLEDPCEEKGPTGFWVYVDGTTVNDCRE